MLGSQIQKALKRLDAELKQAGLRRELTCCGAGALLLLEVIDRSTRDVDVIVPAIDPILQSLSEKVAQEFDLDPNWLNNEPAGLVRDLEEGWQDRAQTVFQGNALTLKALGRRDFIASKLFAYCDRDEQDLDDLIGLKATSDEVMDLKPWVLRRDASALWPARVEKCFLKLLRKIENEDR